MQVLTESIDGFQTDNATVIQAIKAHADKADSRQFDMPGKVITPTVSSKDLPALGITDLMGTGTSTFVGSSQERATNIKVAAGLLERRGCATGRHFLVPEDDGRHHRG